MLGAASNAVRTDPRFSLKGNTLRVYMHLLRRGASDPVGIREVQKELGLSSPTLAKYHLERLQEMGLVKQSEDGSYTLLKEVRVDVIQPFITFGRLMIPRLFTYAVVVSILFAYTVLFVIPSGNAAELGFFAVVTGAASLLALWYETLRSWRNVPA